jgi:hypothetical protein
MDNEVNDFESIGLHDCGRSGLPQCFSERMQINNLAGGCMVNSHFCSPVFSAITV